MDALNLFTVEEVRNLLVKWWCFYKVLPIDAKTNLAFMALAYRKTFEVMSLATLNGEQDNSFLVKAIEDGSVYELIYNVKKHIKIRYPREDDFIDATNKMLMRLYSIPFDGKPLFDSKGR